MADMVRRLTGGAPSLQAPEMFNLTKILLGRLEVSGTTTDGQGRCWISSLHAPTASQRQRLEARRNELATALAPHPDGHADVTDAMLEMFYCWPDTRRMEAGKAAAVAVKYATTMHDLPLWSIRKACEQVAREDRAWPPSPGEVRAVAVKASQAAANEAADLRRVLGAQVYAEPDQSERERVTAGFASLLADLRSTNSALPPARHERRHPMLPSRLDDAHEPRPASTATPSFSPGLRAKLGLVDDLPEARG